MLTVSYEIKAPVNKIWSALTNKDEMKIWYFDIPDFVLEENAVFNFYEPGENKKFLHRCTIQSIQPKKKFQHTWTYPAYSDGVSVVTWNLEETDMGTLVKLTHEGLENFEHAGSDFALTNFEAGWNEIIDKMLRKYVVKV